MQLALLATSNSKCPLKESLLDLNSAGSSRECPTKSPFTSAAVNNLQHHPRSRPTPVLHLIPGVWCLLPSRPQLRRLGLGEQRRDACGSPPLRPRATVRPLGSRPAVRTGVVPPGAARERSPPRARAHTRPGPDARAAGTRPRFTAGWKYVWNYAWVYDPVGLQVPPHATLRDVGRVERAFKKRHFG